MFFYIESYVDVSELLSLNFLHVLRIACVDMDETKLNSVKNSVVNL